MSLAVTIAAAAATLVVWLATARHLLPRRSGPVVAFAAFSFDSVALFALAVDHAGGWMEAAVCFALTAALAAVVVSAEAGRGGGPGRDDSHGGGGGRPDRPPQRPSGPAGDPLWWPEFERQFAAHVERRGARVKLRGR